MKAKLRILNPDSPAYANIGKKCHFCREIFEKKDVVFPNGVMDSTTGEYSAHKACLNYVMEKYPHVNVNELAGKITRMRIKDRGQSLISIEQKMFSAMYSGKLFNQSKGVM